MFPVFRLSDKTFYFDDLSETTSSHRSRRMASDSSASSLTFEENGRHYLKRKRSYMFPCDSVEANRMDIFHKVVSIARGGPEGPGRLHEAPLQLNEHLRILDLGTGTGMWVIEMADLYAGRSEVWGVDINPFQPKLIPANAKFQILDIESDSWHGLGEDSWDLIHLRCLAGAVRAWTPLYRVVLRHLRPVVGHVEHVEIDWRPRTDMSFSGGGGGGSSSSSSSSASGALIPPERSALATWAATLLDCMHRAGRPMHVDAAATSEMLQTAGFVDVRLRTVRLSFGAYSSYAVATAGDGHEADVGRWFLLSFDQWLEALTLGPLYHIGGYGREAMDRMLYDVRRELQDPYMRAYCHL